MVAQALPDQQARQYEYSAVATPLAFLLFRDDTAPEPGKASAAFQSRKNIPGRRWFRKWWHKTMRRGQRPGPASKFYLPLQLHLIFLLLQK